MHFSERNPDKCYLKGNVQNLSIYKILSIFAKEVDAPKPVIDFLNDDGLTTKKLAIELIPKDMISVDGVTPLKQRIYFEGDASFGIFI